MAQGNEMARLDALEREVADLRGELSNVRRARAKLRYLAIATGVLALTITGVATGVTGDTIKEGLRNPATGLATTETQLLSNNGTGYTARLSNFNVGDGGAQSSGCRSSIANEACLQLANLNTGRAFEIIAQGSQGGTITVNGANAKPFTTNATGVATGLNADRVDGQEASALIGPRAYAYVNGGTTATFRAAMTKGFTAVNHSGATGGYCLTPVAGISPDTSPFTASADFGTTFVPDPDAHYHDGFNCNPNQFEVVTTDSGAPTNDIDFTIVVP